MGHLGDPMDKRGDIVLKRAWDTAMVSLKPALATTCVARNFEFWLKQLQEHLTAGTPREDLLKSFPMLFKAVGFIANASTEAVKLSARSAFLSVAARRALWLKTWPGDTASKMRLCSIPFTGKFLFGEKLDEALERTADRKKSFPAKKKFLPRKTFLPFKGQTRDWKGKVRPKKHWTGHKGGQRANMLFNPPGQGPKGENSKQ